MNGCKNTISFDGGTTVVQCARDEHAIELPPADRMALHWDESGTTRWSTYPDFVMASFDRAPADAEKIRHPSHYGGDTVYEARKVIRAWGLGFNLGNVAKYICRAEHKGAPLDDLKKAAFYLNDEIEMRGGA